MSFLLYILLCVVECTRYLKLELGVFLHFNVVYSNVIKYLCYFLIGYVSADR